MLPIEKLGLDLASPGKVKHWDVADHNRVRFLSLVLGVDGAMPAILDLPVDKKEDDGDNQ